MLMTSYADYYLSSSTPTCLQRSAEMAEHASGKYLVVNDSCSPDLLFFELWILVRRTRGIDPTARALADHAAAARDSLAAGTDLAFDSYLSVNQPQERRIRSSRFYRQE